MLIAKDISSGFQNTCIDISIFQCSNAALKEYDNVFHAFKKNS